MSTTFEDRMREGTVSLRDDQAERFSSAIAELSVERASKDSLLNLVRLAFDKEVDDAHKEGFAQQLVKQGLTISPRSTQLVATLATLTLIERFSRGIARRASRSLIPDSVAAAAVIVLDNQSLRPIHPDLAGYARHWNALLTEHFRVTGTFSNPPTIPKSLLDLEEPAKAEDQPQGQATPPRDPTNDLEDLRTYVVSLETWLQRSGTPKHLNSIQEQLDLFWWLMSDGRPNGTPQSIVDACNDLIRISRSSLGPPAAEQLLQRRLGNYASSEIKVEDVAKIAARELSTEIGDMCVLLNGLASGESDTYPASTVASWLYDELQLVTIFERDSQ